MFALAILPLTVSLGVAVDYSVVVRTRALMQTDLDAAVLATLQTTAAMISAGGNPNENDVRTRFSQEMAARGVGFRPAVATSSSVHYTNASHSLTLNATLTASVPVTFGGILGYSAYSVAVNSKASQGSIVYSNINLVLDVSPSMAIAATAADIVNLRALTQAQTGTACAFACHDADGGGNSNYTIAKTAGVRLRFDDMKSAALTLANTVAATAVTGDQFTMGVYTMGAKLVTIQTPTPSNSLVKTAIDAVDFDRMSVVSPTLPAPAPANFASGDSVNHYADSDFTTTLTALNAIVPANAAGTTPATRQQYVFLVTDGLDSTGVLYNPGVASTFSYPSVPNFAGGNDAGKYTRPLNPALCEVFKSRGVQVAVLYVTYVPDPTEYWYQTLVQSNAPPSALVASLTACASPGLFYQASDSTHISTGLTSLFQTIVSRAIRLTN